MRDYPSYGKSNDSRLVRKRPVSNKKISRKLFMTGVILLLVSLFFVHQRIKYVQTERRVQKLLHQKRKLISSILPLQLEEHYLTRYKLVESFAKEKLDLDVPQKKQIIKVVIQQPLPEK